MKKSFLFSILVLFNIIIIPTASAVTYTCKGSSGASTNPPGNYTKDECDVWCKQELSDPNASCTALSSDSQGSGTTVTLDNPLGNTTDPNQLIGIIIKSAMGIIGSLALAMFIFGGVLWMTSAGNAERVTKGKQTLLWATIGMVVIFAAYAVVNFIIDNLGKV